ncbi:transmembrane 6 superfamily member 2 isoform X2 [Scyliorhinus canicula]|uniref:transmembrane 6 superfamily member 2 isoform X2 n=1 Tax=Scyliorhinus canicula TaxID=7830 RepID=UPI0018F6B899|nr:transmembrane 6 superfamily member 2 isoform X2 [Scyliorhinus canicula]
MRVGAGTAAFLLSLSAIPISFLLNRVSAMDSPMVVFYAAAGVLLGLLLVLYLLVIGTPPKDPLFYAFAVFSFTSVIDLVISLEQDGYIKGFMGFYLKEGEPYLRSAYGILICYWDGTVHYALYLMMIAAITLRWSYRTVGLYWLGSMLISLVTLLLGTVVGKFGTEIRPAFLLNIPYVLIPIWAGKKIYRMPKALPRITADQIAMEQSKWLYRRPLDLVFIVYLLIAAAFTVFRGFMLVNMFYLVPFFGLALYGLIDPGCEWMPDLTVVFAGAIAQAQFSHIGASLHPRTAFTYRVPQDVVSSFLYANILFALGAQLLAVRCVTCSNFFLKGMPINNEELEKKVN